MAVLVVLPSSWVTVDLLPRFGRNVPLETWAPWELGSRCVLGRGSGRLVQLHPTLTTLKGIRHRVLVMATRLTKLRLKAATGSHHTLLVTVVSRPRNISLTASKGIPSQTMEPLLKVKLPHITAHHGHLKITRLRVTEVHLRSKEDTRHTVTNSGEVGMEIRRTREKSISRELRLDRNGVGI